VRASAGPSGKQGRSTSHICTGTGLNPPTTARICIGTGLTPPTTAHICTGTGLTPPTTAHICTGTGLASEAARQRTWARAGRGVPIGARRPGASLSAAPPAIDARLWLAGAAISKGVEDWEVKKEQRALAEAMSGKKQKKVCVYKVPLQRGGPPRPLHA
jgi:hypothetical protein